MPAPGLVDLRSDTLTVPDAGMRDAMARAEVGDDVWGEDPTVRRLEEEIARRLGKEAAVYVPSGTMGNLTCVAAQTRPGDEVIADAQAHVVVYEVGGTAIVAGIQLRALDSVDGMPDAEVDRRSVRAEDIHQPVSTLLCIENTHNRRGGAAIDPTRAARGHACGAWARAAGALRRRAALQRRRRPRCRTCGSGGRMRHRDRLRQQGARCAGRICRLRRRSHRSPACVAGASVLVAACVRPVSSRPRGLYALEHNVARLADDHANARVIADAVGACSAPHGCCGPWSRPTS